MEIQPAWQISFFKDSTMRDFLGIFPGLKNDENNLSPIHVDILSFGKLFIESDIA